jgi:hypothetical protein
MVNRRDFVKLGLLSVPLSGCATNREPARSPEEMVDAVLSQTNAKLPSEVMEEARRYAAEMQSAQQAVANHDVSYDVEPRFFPSMK